MGCIIPACNFIRDVTLARLKRTSGIQTYHYFIACALLGDHWNAGVSWETLMGGQAQPKSVHGMPADVSCCDYHKHEEGVVCGNRKRKRAAEDGEH